MQLLRNPLTTVILIIVILLLVFSNFKACHRENLMADQNKELQAALADTVRHFVNKQGEQVAQIQTIRTERAKDFVKMKTKDEEIIKLQGRVKEYEKKLKKQGSSVTNTTTETKLDTIVKTEVVVVADTAYPVYRSHFKDKWISLDIKASVDSSEYSLKTHDEYSTIVGYEKRKKKWFTDVVSSSPYTSVKTTRTYQTTLPKQKQYNISVGGGYGYTPFGFTWNIGIYAGKTILRL